MNETDTLPVFAAIAPKELYKVEVSWTSNPEARQIVDLAPHVLRYAAYKPLRDNQKAWATLKLIDDGVAAEWLNGECDISADAVWAVQKSQVMPADELRSALAELKLSPEAAAATFGYSRRQIFYYISGEKPVPRMLIWALRGFVADLKRKPVHAAEEAAAENMSEDSATASITWMLRRFKEHAVRYPSELHDYDDSSLDFSAVTQSVMQLLLETRLQSARQALQMKHLSETAAEIAQGERIMLEMFRGILARNQKDAEKRSKETAG